MTLRYEESVLMHLRGSPLCVKPANLPPIQEWMGPPPEAHRTQNKPTADKAKGQDGQVLDNSARRNIDRLLSRPTASPEDTSMGSFGAPRSAFGGVGLRGPKATFDTEKTKENDHRERFGIRPRNAENDGTDRLRDGRNSNFRRRDGEDSDGWSTVKPRKSFGHDGAERFNGKMGGERIRDDRKPRESDDQDKAAAGSRRGFDSIQSKDKDAEDGDGRTRNGARGKTESWFKTEAPADGLTARERIDKAKSWRERNSKDAEAPPLAADDRSSVKTYDRRWGRDREQRVEREPEWMEPADSKSGGHTEEDFKRFLENMKAREAGTTSKPSAPAAQPVEPPPDTTRPDAEPAPPPRPVEVVPDKFFMAFAQPPGFDGGTPGVSAEPNDTQSPMPKPAGKSSRFTSFFNASHEEKRMREVPMQPPAHMPGPPSGGAMEPLEAAPPEEEKAAFQQLLMKLQKQSLQVSPSPTGSQSFQAPPTTSSAGPALSTKAAVNATPPGPSHVRYGSSGSRGAEPPADDARNKMPWAMQEIIAPQPMLPQQTAAARQDQLLQNLVGHRAGSGQRMDPNAVQRDSNTEFLMNLMRSQPEAPRTEQVMLRMPQPQKSAPIPHVAEREPDFAHNGRFPQQQQQQQQQSQQNQQNQQQQQPQSQSQSQPQPPPHHHQSQHHHQQSQHHHQQQQQLHQHHQPQPQSQPPPQHMQQQQRQMRPQPPAAYMDDPAFHQGEPEPRLPQQQPQILQRPPPPPGLDQMGPAPGWMPSGPGPVPQQRILPPPGLPGGLNRNMPPPNMYPPNFPPPQGPVFSSPDGMGLPPPRNMQPMPGVYGGPPPGFFPPPGAFQGPPPDVPFGAFDRMPPGVPRGFPRP